MNRSKKIPAFAGMTVFVVFCLLLTACGMKPLYGTQNNEALRPVFNTIYVDNIPNHEGQHLRNLLIDRLYNKGRPSNPAYTLSLEPIKERHINLDITKTADATRAQLRLNTEMTLTDKSTNEQLLERDLTVVTSYNILNSQFTTHVSEENARLNALEDLARQVETQLALYFERTL